jgi:predicted nucleic acid-binding protein
VTASFIVDCSITMTWCFADEATKASSEIQDRLVSESALVPAHWFLEVANVLAMAEKRRRITPAKSDEFIRLLRLLELEVDDESPDRAFDRLLPLCRKHGLTSYDAAYLELAVRRQLPLASLDDDLRAAAAKIGVMSLGR